MCVCVIAYGILWHNTHTEERVCWYVYMCYIWSRRLFHFQLRISLHLDRCSYAHKNRTHSLTLAHTHRPNNNMWTLKSILFFLSISYVHLFVYGLWDSSKRHTHNHQRNTLGSLLYFSFAILYTLIPLFSSIFFIFVLFPFNTRSPCVSLSWATCIHSTLILCVPNIKEHRLVFLYFFSLLSLLLSLFFSKIVCICYTTTGY